MNNKISELKKLAEDADKTLRSIQRSELEEKKNLSLSFWQLFIQNNKSIALLLEGHFHNEAFLVYRLSMEHFFNIFALIRSDDFLDKIKNSSDLAIQKAINELNKGLKAHEYKPLTPENRDNLLNAVKHYENFPIANLGHKIYNAAKASEVGDFYDSVYRIVSLSYAHSTYLSATRRCEEYEVLQLLKNAIDFMKITMALVAEEFPDVS
ncbi:MAG: hypothetical protein K2Y09_10490 [Nitrosomonas sp.]|uniref:DUF5677 domain-containing protein n=1 Tax=Nitrosomonas sp. TaxID=42353 RepID=UPI001DB77D2D|nr:DUF5677 domain-containing protein [Nitrosomonas sp.]MBX9895593.1 hypothetical protein [Nitrosomonas sp.]